MRVSLLPQRGCRLLTALASLKCEALTARDSSMPACVMHCLQNHQAAPEVQQVRGVVQRAARRKLSPGLMPPLSHLTV